MTLSAAGLDGSDPIAVHVKMLRQELLEVGGHLERDLGPLVLDCTRSMDDPGTRFREL